MYGNLEYGAFPYGDSVKWTVVVVDKRDIEVIFMSLYKNNTFLSQEIQSIIFSSARKDSVFAAFSKTNMFKSENKISTFRSEDYSECR